MLQKLSFSIGILLTSLLALVIVVLLQRQERLPERGEKKLRVVCTTSMITDVVQHVGKDTIEVSGLMGPGIDPHLYRASEGDLHKLASAHIIFYNGLHLEGKMGDIVHKMNGRTKTVAVTDAIAKNELIATDFEDMYDPHVWHDVWLWIQAVEKIRDSLIAIDPDNALAYEKHAYEYLAQLKALDVYVKQEVEKIQAAQRILVTAHDAFSYFGRAYGFKVVGLQGISTDAQVGTKDIRNLASFIVEHKICAIFFESSIPYRMIEAVQQAVQARGWQVTIGNELFSDALGNYDSLAGTYIGMIKHNIDVVVASLTGTHQ